MRRLRNIAFTLLVIYATLTVAVGLHYHSRGTDGAGVHCNLCQVSQICLEEAGTARVTAVLPQAPFLETEQAVVTGTKLAPTVPQRAPPIA